MARFLICSMPLVGHVHPGLPIARALIARGHEVRWYTGRRFQSAVEATGAQYVPMEAALDFDDRNMDAAFPGTAERTGLAAFKYDVKHVFFDAAQGQIADLQRILQTFPADVILSDTAFVGAGMLHEMGGPPWATYGISALTLSSHDTAPFGLALPPDSSLPGRIRNRVLAALFDQVLFRDVNAYLGRIRREIGLAHNGLGALNTLSPYLYLQGSTPSFEYPRSDLPPQVHFVGPLLDDPPANFTPPIWWDDLHGSKPVVLVTQGTISNESTDLLKPTLQALADEDVLVVATTGGQPIDETLLDSLLTEGNYPFVASSHTLLASGALISFGGYSHAQIPRQRRTRQQLPSNVRLESFIPFAHLMPHVDVLITNGGFGGVQLALANGVPLIVAGTTQEKPEIAVRVAWSGAGINLKTRTPSPDQMRTAVRTVLSSESYRCHAERIGADYAQHNAQVEVATLLEQLARSRQPVLRGAAPIERPRGAQLAASS